MKIDLNEALDTLDSMRELDSEEGVANALLLVAVAYLERGKAELAAEPLEEAYYYCRKLDNQPGRAHVSLRQGQMELSQGRPGESAAKYREALEVFQGAGDIPGQVTALEGLAQALTAGDDQARAIEALEQALALVEQGDDQVALVLLRQYVAPLYRHLGRHEEALDAYLEMGRGAQALGDLQRVALALLGAGAMQAQTGRTGVALKNLGQARRAFSELGQATLAEQVGQEIARLEAALGSPSPDSQEDGDA
ncbi:MAG: tetratricopeptide repeat protein [Pseudomonadota bacterium]